MKAAQHAELRISRMNIGKSHCYATFTLLRFTSCIQGFLLLLYMNTKRLEQFDDRGLQVISANPGYHFCLFA
jgi:hypothetical protein